jgi:hypothetical protein
MYGSNEHQLCCTNCHQQTEAVPPWRLG